MSDLTASAFSPESQLQSDSQFDVSKVDENFRAMSSVEGKWRLPALPDEVKLDLAMMPGLTHQDLTQFLLGIDSDMHDQEEPEPSIVPPSFIPEQTATDKFRIYAAGITQSRPPEEVTTDAVRRFKFDAIQRGLLPEGTPMDSTWSPELNRMRSEMLYDQYNDRLRGDRPGAVPVNKVLEQLGKWTSPSGLLAAATELDLFWDFGAISREWSTWGDKWRKVGDSKNPLDFSKNLIDAVTGPIDDIVFPALNLALLTTGLGALANGGRLAFLGERALEGGRLMRGLYSASGLVLPSEVGQIKEASWMAKRLMSHGSMLGDAMAAWRNFEPVARIKQGVQLGMRTGVISQLEDLLPGYQGGHDLSGVGPVQSFAQAARGFSHGALATPIELALAPYQIFRSGTFVGSNGLVSLTGGGLYRAAGTIPGRAVIGAGVGAGVGAITGDEHDVLEGVTYGALAGALLPSGARVLQRAPMAVKGAVGGALVGAGVAAVTDVNPEEAIGFGAVTGASLVPIHSVWAGVPNPGKWVGYATDVLSKFSYRPIAEDQGVALAFHKGMRAALSENPEALQRWDDAFMQNNSLLRTLGDFLGTDEEGAAAAMSYVLVAAAIDHTAAAQAAGQVGDSYHLFRNKLISQLRTFDLNGDTQFLPEEVARAMAIDRTFGGDYTRQFERTLSQLTPETAYAAAKQHNELAEQTLQQLMSLENMPDLQLNNAMGPWNSLPAQEKLGILEAYLPKALPTFANWPHFTSQAHQVQAWVNEGLLDGAEFAAVRTPWGSLRQPRADVFKVSEKIIETDEQIVDTILRNPTVLQKTRGGRLAPLARLQPTGRFTVARHDTVTKQQLEEMAYHLEDLVHASEALRAHGSTLRTINESLAQEASALGRGTETFKDLTRDELATYLRANGFAKNQKELTYLHAFMNRNGVTDSDLAAMVDEQITMMVGDEGLWSGLGLSPMLRGEDNRPLAGVQALKRRIKDVRTKARYTAAEIDPQSLLRSVTESHGEAAANELLLELDQMQRDGYKLVHGVEYLMPHDLAVNTDLFRDIGTREMNSRTLGNFFGRRHPAVARMQQERRERLQLVKALADHGVGDFSVNDERITLAHKDLRAILNEIQDPIATRLEERHLLSFMDRKRLALESTFAPMRVEDLTLRRPFVIDRLTKLGWTDEEANAIFSSIRHFRDTEFKNLGFYAFEAKMRERNELVQALKFLGGSKYSNGILSSQRLGMAAGAFAGQAYATQGLDENASDSDVLGARVLGLVGGAAAGALGAKAISMGVSRNGWIDDMILRAEQKPAFMIADHLVRLRDGLRFGLSPWFDTSRYTEGLMLSQTAAPLRHPVTGERVALPLNMSPSAVKKRLGGEQAWQTMRREFSQIGRGRGVGDVDVLDDAGHWFSQVGIMGFSPQDWEAGMYAELRQRGFDAETAFRAARDTHTYGVGPRSAAEMSTNFIFFPFSFQKKALTHLTKWMQDDLSRSIMIHDGLAAYQALNEKYNLDEYWKDHIPALEQLNKLNLLAYGISPGRFGGINAQVFETLGRAAILFTPMAVNIQNKKDFLELQSLMRQNLPAINDINWMMHDLKQTPGLWSPSHELEAAQVRDAYVEWNDYRQQLLSELEDSGFTWSDMQNKPYLSSIKLQYEAKRAELGSRYPAWAKARQESLFNIEALAMEKDDLLAAGAADPQGASAQARMVAQFEVEVADVKRLLRYQGVSVDGPDGWTDAPPWAFDYLRELAVNMQQTDPRFVGVYNKFYRKELGPIEAPL